MLYLTHAITAWNTCSSFRTFSSSLEMMSTSWFTGSSRNSSLSTTYKQYQPSETPLDEATCNARTLHSGNQNQKPEYNCGRRSYLLEVVLGELVCDAQEVSARMRIGKGADPEAVRRIQLPLQELTAHVLYLRELQQTRRR